MKKLIRLGDRLNAFTFGYEDSLLNEIRASFIKDLGFLRNPTNQFLFKGGRRFFQPVGNYFLVSSGDSPLLWFSASTPETFGLFQNFFDRLE
ncbi:MAG TPA: hypothetical protein V6D23_20530, partial [Candidatus Obscuribacterales bacterium]